MEAFSGSPLTLVIKAPNQEIGDQTVECFLDWTVRKLKKHLSAVYPTNPNERSQRIIYSGQLLQDNLLLKDVISVNDAQEKCTVHLVCTPSAEEQAKQKREAMKKMRPCSSSPVLSSSDGVRQRTSTPAHQTQAPGPSTQHHQQQQHPAGYTSATSLPSTPGPVPVPHPGAMPTASMSPQQQLQWMQQVYAQQMYAQQLTYMQQYASMMAASGSGQPGWHHGYQMPSPWLQPHPVTSINQTHPAPPQQHQPAPPVDNVAPPQGAAPPLNNNAQQQAQRMNVGGGQAMDDDNEDGMRRDWLDWIFTLCRFGILLSIVYFYSSVNRFLVVGGAMFLMYLYQAGYFQLRRRARNQPPVAPPQEPAAQREETPEEGASEESDNQPEESDSSTSASDEVDGNGAAEPEEPPRPGMLAMAWIFVSTFFTSIIPQGPAQQFPAN